MVGEHAVYNGKIILQSEAVVPVTQREVQSGFYVYESLRVIQAHPVHLEDHLVRLETSAGLINLVYPFSREEIASWVHALIEVDLVEKASLRIQIYGGKQPQLFITTSEILTYPESFYTEGVKSLTYEGERLLPGAKTGNLLLNYLALEEAKRQGCFEALLVDEEQKILEGTRSNFFAIKDGQLFTAQDEKVLLGITRDRVLKAARLLGLHIRFEAPSLNEVVDGFYDELFISATSMAAMPLSQVDGTKVKKSFSFTREISSLVRQWELED
nr:aminotransferase class IV [uncultured Sphaerochaeta sp.]